MSIEILSASVQKLTYDIELLVAADKEKAAKIVTLTAQIAELTAASNPSDIDALTASVDAESVAINAELNPVV